MKQIFAYLFLSLLSVLSIGCSSEEEDILSRQKASIVSFLEGSHIPKLVAEENVGQEGSSQEYYTYAGDAVYRYIANIGDPDRAGRAEVNASSRVTVTFTTYLFNNTRIETTGTSRTMPLYTNDPALANSLQQAGLNTEYWNFTPLTIDMSDTGTINGVYHALSGCREGDVVETYMTFNMAYGDKKPLGLVPAESPIAWFFTVNSVQ